MPEGSNLNITPHPKEFAHEPPVTPPHSVGAIEVARGVQNHARQWEPSVGPAGEGVQRGHRAGRIHLEHHSAARVTARCTAMTRSSIEIARHVLHQARYGKSSVDVGKRSEILRLRRPGRHDSC